VDELIATLRRGIEFKQFHAERASASAAPSIKAADVESRRWRECGQ
jgi:hypothetical protein